MRQIWAWVRVTLTAILVLVSIIRIVKFLLSQTGWFKDRVFSFWREKIKSLQIKKELKEDKEKIINPNSEDTKTNEEFQKVIETAVAERAVEEKDEKKNELIYDSNEKKKNIKAEEIGHNKETAETSIFEKTISLDTPSEKALNDKEKKMIDRIIIETTTLKNGWKYDEYEKKIIEWLAIDPSNLELTKMLADYYFVTGSYKKSISLLKKIIEWDSEDHKALWQIWEIYFINWDNETAELLIDKAVNLKPDSPKYNLSLVEIYYNTGRIMEAISCMEKVIKLRPTNTNYLFTLAMLYEEIWDIANAKKNYYTIMEFEPNNEKAKKKLRQYSE